MAAAADASADENVGAAADVVGRGCMRAAEAAEGVDVKSMAREYVRKRNRWRKEKKIFYLKN